MTSRTEQARNAGRAAVVAAKGHGQPPSVAIVAGSAAECAALGLTFAQWRDARLANQVLMGMLREDAVAVLDATIEVLRPIPGAWPFGDEGVRGHGAPAERRTG